jgi:glycosyltransferase involved in cell wall biosynthesis
MPVVSIIIPFHDREAELPQTLASVAAQTLSDFEALIVNDRSSPTAREVAVSIIASDSRFKLLDLPNGRSGAPAARNLGVAASTGEFVIFLDSDDALSSDCLEHRVALLRSRPDLDYVVSRCQLFTHQPGDLGLLWNADIGPETPEHDLDRLLRMDVPWQTTSPTWRRVALDKIMPLIDGPRQIWDETVLSGQDWEFHIRAILSQLKYERLDRIDCHWRVAGSSRDSIGKSSFSPQHVLQRSDLLERLTRTLAAAGRLDDRNKLLLAAQFFQSAEAIARRANRRKARDAWKRARSLGLIDARRYFRGWLHLFLSRKPKQREKSLGRLRLIWPEEFFTSRSKYFNKAPIEGRAPTISVVTSTYNNAAYLREAIDSILLQTYRDFEFIIINDGSMDDTLAILREYEAADCRVRVVSRENKGLTVSLNEGISLARGKYIARMDADDIAYRDRFAQQFAFMDANPGIVCCGTQIRLVDPFGSALDQPARPLAHEQIDAELLAGSGWAMVHPTVMMRTDAVRQVGAYRPEYNTVEDLDLFQRLAEVGRVANLDSVQLDYRQHLGSVNKTKLNQQIELTKKLLTEAALRRGVEARMTPYVEARQPIGPHEQYVKWGWKALKQGNVGAARKHAKQAMHLKPLNKSSLRLLGATLRGR